MEARVLYPLDITTLGRHSGRRRLTCIHEAGHCLGRWFLGFETDFAAVLTLAEVRNGALLPDRRGRLERCEGITAGYDIYWPALQNSSMVCGRDVAYQTPEQKMIFARAEMALTEIALGCVAEAKYRHRSLIACHLEGGANDSEQARSIVGAWLSRVEKPYETAFRRASVIANSKSGWIAIRAMADRLMANGAIVGKEINSICSSAYGNVSWSYGAWDNVWPPTNAQLRQGIF